MEYEQRSLGYIPEAFFDIIGYFFPGFFLFMAIILFIPYITGLQLSDIFFKYGFPKNIVLLLSIVVVCSYMLGHLLSVSSRLFLDITFLNSLLEGKENNFEKMSNLFGTVQNEFYPDSSFPWPTNNEMERRNYLFSIAEKYVRVKCPDLGQFIRKRHSQKVMSRNLGLALLLVRRGRSSHFYLKHGLTILI